MAAVVLVAAAAAACTNDGGQEAPPPTTQAHDAWLSTSGITRVDLGRRVGPVAVGEGGIVFPASSTGGRDWTHVQAVPLAGGAPRTIAATRFRRGLINWVAASSDGWIYYVDQSARQSDQDPDVLWRVIAVDPASHTRQTIDSNGDTPDPYVPIIHAQDGWAFWSTAEADGTARERVWKPGWAHAQVLLRHTEMTPGSESLSGDLLVYLGKAATGATGHTIGGDCWSVPLTGGTPSALTHTALAMWCTADDAWLVWTQHIGPSDPVPVDDGVLDDPYGLWAVPIGGGEPQHLHEGYIPSTNPYVTNAVLVWLDFSGHRIVQDLDEEDNRLVLDDEGALQSAAGNGQVLVLPGRHGNENFAGILPLPG